MTVGMIGAGYIAKMLAEKLILAGHNVELSNSRGPESLQGIIGELGSQAKAVSAAEAAAREVVFLAVRWENLEAALVPLKDQLKGVLIDTTNPFDNKDKLLKFPDTSASEIVADLVPQAKVVKAFNSLYGQWIEAEPVTAGGNRVAFISGDDLDAKTTVANLVRDMGFAPVDLGDLATGIIQQAGYPLAGLNLVKLK